MNVNESSGWSTIFSHISPNGKSDLKLRCAETMDNCNLVLINNDSK